MSGAYDLRTARGARAGQIGGAPQQLGENHLTGNDSVYQLKRGR